MLKMWQGGGICHGIVLHKTGTKAPQRTKAKTFPRKASRRTIAVYESRTRRCGEILNGHSKTYWSTAFGMAGAQGGVCISIVDIWQAAIEARGIIVPRRPRWIILRVGEMQLRFFYL